MNIWLVPGYDQTRTAYIRPRSLLKTKSWIQHAYIFSSGRKMGVDVLPNLQCQTWTLSIPVAVVLITTLTKMTMNMNLCCQIWRGQGNWKLEDPLKSILGELWYLLLKNLQGVQYVMDWALGAILKRAIALNQRIGRSF